MELDSFTGRGACKEDFPRLTGHPFVEKLDVSDSDSVKPEPEQQLQKKEVYFVLSILLVWLFLPAGKLSPVQQGSHADTNTCDCTPGWGFAQNFTHAAFHRSEQSYAGLQGVDVNRGDMLNLVDLGESENTEKQGWFEDVTDKETEVEGN